MATFVSKRDQFVDGNAVKEGEKVTVDADRVKYLVSRGFLVEAEEKAPAKKTTKSKQAE